MSKVQDYQLKIFGAKIADINYFNETHKIIRVEFDRKFYDFKFLGGYEVPNPSRHMAVVSTTEKVMSGVGISEERLSLLPGYANKEGSVIDLPLGFVTIFPINQVSSTTYPNSGSAGFSINKTNMFDLDKASIAISPPLNKDYTNSDIDDDNKNQSVGIFMNSDGTILIKSKGASITMGKEGLFFAGKVGWDSSVQEQEWQADNPLAPFLGSTIPTYVAAFSKLPNLGKFAQMALGSKKIRDVVSKGKKIGTALSSLGG
jgi:hypothetical protein